MTAPSLVTRGMLLKDIGKAGLAMVILGTAACTDETGDEASTTVLAGEGTTSTPPAGDHRWFRVNLEFVSAYILYMGGSALIVDTGVEGSADAIGTALTEAGLGWDQVGAVVVTHRHPDHAGSLEAVLDQADEGVPWFAGAGDIAAISAPTEGEIAVDGMAIEHLQIYETPGHTPGHISVLDPLGEILVAGDALNGADGAVAGPNPDFSEDMVQANASVAKLAGFDYEVALFGHGEPVLEAASALVAGLADSLDGG